MSNYAQEYLEAVTAEDREITINIKICDSEKAKDLLGTMYDKNIDQFGVAVQSWGFWDIQKANKLRIESINAEIERHQQIIRDLMYKTDQEYLTEADS